MCEGGLYRGGGWTPHLPSTLGRAARGLNPTQVTLQIDTYVPAAYIVLANSGEMSKGSFGEHLRREREMRGVSLDEISVATRITTRFLEAMETEQWDRLPGGVFNRGFVRAVARFLGLNEENLVAEYKLAIGDQAGMEVAAGQAIPAPPLSEGLQAGSPRWLPWLLAFLAVALLAGGWFAWHRYAAWRTARRHAPPPAEQSTAVPPRAGDAQAGAPAGSTATTPPSSEPAAQIPTTITPPGTPAAEPAALELTIAAGKNTKIRVSADGKSVLDGKITAGQMQRFQAQKKFEIWAQDSSALLLELNGETMAPMGPPDQPGQVTLTHKDLKKQPGGAD